MTMGAAEPALDSLTHVSQQMPPVRDLDRRRRSHRDATGIFGRTVACDDLDLRALPQPTGQRSRVTIGQQVDDTMPLEVDDDRAIAAPFALRPVVNTGDARHRLIRQG